MTSPERLSDATCTNAATCLVFWPGREPFPMCDGHAAMARGVAAAMGFPLTIETSHGLICTQKIKAKRSA